SHVGHAPTDKFILDCASHHSAKTHCAMTNLGTRPITQAKWTQALEHGLHVWRLVPIKPRKPRKA
ncbi:hypothetical protein DFH28DRAFT_826007, partial [Melampsora americana]